MKLGLLYEIQRAKTGDAVDENLLYKETLDQCALADEMGFDYVWLVEHHFLTGFSASPSPEVLAGALSQRTKRIRIGFGVCILPYHHPVRVAERVAMVDQLTNGRVELGTGRSNTYEQTGMGVDPRVSRDMWEESVTMISKIWQSEEFSWEGRFWNVPPRRVLPKPYQKPHPPIWLACLQPETFALAAKMGLGVLFSPTYAPAILAEHVRSYRENIRNAKPVGAFVNEQWANNVFAYCGEDDLDAKELCTRSLKTFFGPDRPYTQGRAGVYEQLLADWGGVPDHLKADFGRFVGKSDEKQRDAAAEAGISLDSGPVAARAAFTRMDAETLSERGVIVAGDPASCIKSLKMYEEIGVDQMIMIMQTETIPHEKVMKSIEMFGKYVLPAFQQGEPAKPGAAR